MPDALTDRQREILDFITASINERGYPPTLREIGEHFGIRSTNGVNDHLKALEKKGHLRREDLKSRAMRPTSMLPSSAGAGADVIPIDRKLARGTGTMGAVGNVEMLQSNDDDLVDIPILGRVAAGQPILAVENVQDTVRIDRVMVGGHREVFGLRIVGESMIDDGIFDGDYVFVKKTPVARNGEIVVAMIEGEATVKRYYPEGDHVRFQPANANMRPIIVNKADFKQVDIIGIVVGVYRKL
ncbi:MAG: transcriptional repressor LexA [Kofleriaceae bacterium]|nr:transcriptional repressor LexA [Myxococcales bacterium]MCB9559752.1 transcriptional repressor LexA [Kofleriaceae bacterium]MCB9572944.1 transcriptional repressor LexA [Kofleriaceae bacterium]